MTGQLTTFNLFVCITDEAQHTQAFSGFWLLNKSLKLNQSISLQRWCCQQGSCKLCNIKPNMVEGRFSRFCFPFPFHLLADINANTNISANS